MSRSRRPANEGKTMALARKSLLNRDANSQALS
jgi:hypothetical protein